MPVSASRHDSLVAGAIFSIVWFFPADNYSCGGGTAVAWWGFCQVGARAVNENRRRIRRIARALDSLSEVLGRVDCEVEWRGVDLFSGEESAALIDEYWHAASLSVGVQIRLLRLIGQLLCGLQPHGGDRRSMMSRRVPTKTYAFHGWELKLLRKMGSARKAEFEQKLSVLEIGIGTPSASTIRRWLNEKATVSS